MSLLLEIFRCPNVATCLGSDGDRHPCATIVRNQKTANLALHQMPEPWMGDLKHARILFLGSNPSIGTDHEYPKWEDPDEKIEDFFKHQFGGGRIEWTSGGTHKLIAGGRKRRVVYWAEVKKMAEEVLGRPAVAGTDYAMTEIVHCKSKQEIGVAQAANECVDKYFHQMLVETPAQVVVVLGRTAKLLLKDRLGITDDALVIGPMNLGMKLRTFVFLPHPSSWGPADHNTFQANLTSQELAHVKGLVQA